MLLLKTHVSGLDDGAYMTDDAEALLVRYAGFLAAAAGQTTRLNASIVEKSAVTVFGVSGGTAHRFGQSMAHAMAHAYGKGCKATSGRKLSDAVKTVCLGFRCEAMQPLQSSLASPSRLGVPNSGASGSQDPEPEAVVVLPSVVLPSAGSSMTLSEIAALYGVSPAEEKRSAAVEIVSSQEVLSQDTPQEGQAKPKRRRMREKGAALSVFPPAPANQDGGAPLVQDASEFRSRAEWSDLHERKHHVMKPDGTVSVATLEEGPTGFCQAMHAGRSVTTEIPNLALALAVGGGEAAGGAGSARQKRRTFATVCAADGARTAPKDRRPVAAPDGAAEGSVAGGAAACEVKPPHAPAAMAAPAEEQGYQILYYKLTNMVGIREKRGKNAKCSVSAASGAGRAGRI